MRLLRLALALSLAAAPCFAQSASAKKNAGAHYQRGVGLFKEGDYASALSEFKAAYQAVPSWEVLYNIGLTERRLFKYGQAVRTLNRFLDEGGKKVPRDRRESVEKELDQIRELTSKVTVKVEGKPANVYVDGEPAGLSPLPEPVLLGPGVHTFKAEREGGDKAEQTVELVSGSTREVKLTPQGSDELTPMTVTIETQPPGAVLTVDGKLAGVSPTRVELPPGGHEVVAENDGYQSARSEFVVTAGQQRTVSVKMIPGGQVATAAPTGKRRFPVAGTLITVAGLGLLGGGLILNLQAQAASKKVSELFQTGGTWDESYAAVEAGGQRSQTWSYVLTTTGAIAVPVGIVVMLVSLLSAPPEEEGEEPSATSFFLVPQPNGGATVGCTVRF